MSKNNNILVTGGTGFIGRSLVIRLIKNGLHPIVFDNNFRGNDDFLKINSNDFTFFKGDIRDKEQVKIALKECSSVFHLAFINGTRFFYEEPELVLDVGVKGAINTIELAKEFKVEKYILASSSEVYQKPLTIPTAEDAEISIPDVTNPRYSYGGGKILSELLTLNFLRNTNVKHTIFRPHNVFGAQMGFEHVIPEILKKISIASDYFIKPYCEIEIQGSGDETRAFCYVEDAIDQLMYIFNNGKNRNIYHIGMNDEISIKKLIKDISKILNIDISIKSGKIREGGTDRRCPSIEKICSIGYKKENNYYNGLKNTVEWYKNYYIKNKEE